MQMLGRAWCGVVDIIKTLNQSLDKYDISVRCKSKLESDYPQIPIFSSPATFRFSQLKYACWSNLMFGKILTTYVTRSYYLKRSWNLP